MALSPGTHTEDDSDYPLPYVENRTTSDICGSALAQLGDAWCYVDVYAEWILIKTHPPHSSAHRESSICRHSLSWSAAGGDERHAEY